MFEHNHPVLFVLLLLGGVGYSVAGFFFMIGYFSKRRQLWYNDWPELVICDIFPMLLAGPIAVLFFVIIAFVHLTNYVKNKGSVENFGQWVYTKCPFKFTAKKDK